jgi:hypothetical protein
MTALVAAALRGRVGPGTGPQALGHRRRHHSTALATHTAEATTVAGKARFRTRAATSATTRSIGK